MKRKRFWAIILAVLALLVTACVRIRLSFPVPRAYEHIPFVSTIEKDTCFLCSKKGGYWGQDNVGLVNLNTFEVILVEINRYNSSKQLIEEATGTFEMRGGKIGETAITMMTDCDRGYSHVSIESTTETINPEATGNYLCQDCLDTLGSKFYVDDTVSAIALLNYSSQELSPLVECTPWFTFEDFIVDCTFKDNGKICLQIIYRPVRYQ